MRNGLQSAEGLFLSNTGRPEAVSGTTSAALEGAEVCGAVGSILRGS